MLEYEVVDTNNCPEYIRGPPNGNTAAATCMAAHTDGIVEESPSPVDIIVIIALLWQYPRTHE